MNRHILETLLDDCLKLALGKGADEVTRTLTIVRIVDSLKSSPIFKKYKIEYAKDDRPYKNLKKYCKELENKIEEHELTIVRLKQERK
jgi:hypothetical protein